MSQISIDVESIQSAIDKLQSVSQAFSPFGRVASHVDSSLLRDFSPVSGLDHAGRTHETIIGEYQPPAARAFVIYMKNAAALLESNVNNTLMADADFSMVMSDIGVGSNDVFKQRVQDVEKGSPAPVLINPTIGRFANTPAVAGPQSSLPGLHSQIMATFPEIAVDAAAQWASDAEAIARAVASLDGVKALLASSAETSWVSEAIARVNRIQWVGGDFAAKAGALSGHTSTLAAVAKEMQIHTTVAHGTWMALPSPEEKVPFEQAYLAYFPAMLTARLVPVTPMFDQLLQPLSEMPGDDYVPESVSVPKVPGFGESRLPRVVAEAFHQRGFGDVAQAQTPEEVIEQFGDVNPDVLEALSAGASPTQAAAVAAPSMPPSLHPGAGISAGVPGSGGLGAGVSSPVFAGASGAFGGGVIGGGPVGGAGSGRGGAGVSRGLAYGAAPGAAVPRGGLVSPGVSVTPGVSSGAHASRGYPVGAPVGPAGGGRDNPRKRIKAVTSAVERDGNLRALLGEAPALLPEVIGDNVRQPRDF